MKKSHPLFSIVILGPPGSGKGTQAKCLSRFFDLEHVDVGMALRRLAQGDSPLAHQVDTLIHTDKALVPDEIVKNALHNLFEGVAEEKSIVLDGAPRKEEQIHMVEEEMKKVERPLLCVISLTVKEEALIDRISHRYFCPRCMGFYIDGKDVEDATKDSCPRCHYPLEKRKDDTAEGVRKRLSIFHEETQPVIEAYRRAGRLIEIDGEREIDVVCGDLHEAIVRIIENTYED